MVVDVIAGERRGGVGGTEIAGQSFMTEAQRKAIVAAEAACQIAREKITAAMQLLTGAPEGERDPGDPLQCAYDEIYSAEMRLQYVALNSHKYGWNP